MKKIDINNVEQILKECDIDYYCSFDECARELSAFYNDIQLNSAPNFDKCGAFIDLGRIAITLNEQAEKIKELEEAQNQKAIEVLEKLNVTIRKRLYSNASIGSMQECVAYDVMRVIDGQLAELKGE